MSLNIQQHPCFSSDARNRFARIHLPVAPGCNIQCNFCKRVYDCANEIPSGATTAVLSPKQAIHYLDLVLKKEPRISVVGIAGPGDPFATPNETLETLRLVRENHPEMFLCVTTNGLGVEPWVDALASLKISHVTLTVNAVDPEIGAKCYAWVRDKKRIHRGVDGAKLLLERQLAAIQALKNRGITVKINTVIITGVNDHHVADVAKRVAELGADIVNCMPLDPVEGTEFASIPSPTDDAVAAIRQEAAQYLPVMEHCTRADASGILGEPMQADIESCLLQAASFLGHVEEKRPNVAVATLGGVLVNQHLGEAEQIAVYEKTEGGFQLVEMRRTPPAGGGTQRWLDLAETLGDCRAILVASAGRTPRSVLAEQGIQVVMMEGPIEEGLDAVYRDVPVRSTLCKQHRCGGGCGCAANGLSCS